MWISLQPEWFQTCSSQANLRLKLVCLLKPWSIDSKKGMLRWGRRTIQASCRRHRWLALDWFVSACPQSSYSPRWCGLWVCCSCSILLPANSRQSTASSVLQTSLITSDLLTDWVAWRPWEANQILTELRHSFQQTVDSSWKQSSLKVLSMKMCTSLTGGWKQSQVSTQAIPCILNTLLDWK